MIYILHIDSDYYIGFNSETYYYTNTSTSIGGLFESDTTLIYTGTNTAYETIDDFTETVKHNYLADKITYRSYTSIQDIIDIHPEEFI